MLKYEKFILKNGLKVIVYQDKTATLASINILYNVGSIDEDENKTGFAHLFEHLMFGGSKNIPNFDTVLQNAGGENNAFTNNDYTNYYLTIPRQNIETAFYLESDRMEELAFSKKSLEVQRNVVSEEFRQRYFNKPYGDVSLYIRPLAYKVHPYKWNTIGKNIEDIQNAKLQDVKNFFYNYYAPNNAIMVVAGNVGVSEIYKLSEKWFGNIPARNIKIRNIIQEPQQTETRKLVLERNVPNDAIFMTYHTCGRLDNDYYASDLISDMLSNGKSSLFNVNLIKDKQLFFDIDAYISGTFDPGLLHISGKLFPNISFENAEKAVKIEIEKICNGNFSDRDLEKVKNKFISNLKFEQIDNSEIAMNLAYYECLGCLDLINSISEEYKNVTKEKIISVANKIFKEENLSCIYYNKSAMTCG